MLPPQKSDSATQSLRAAGRSKQRPIRVQERRDHDLSVKPTGLRPDGPTNTCDTAGRSETAKFELEGSAPRPGFEPGTYRLTAGRSTVELSRNADGPRLVRSTVRRSDAQVYESVSRARQRLADLSGVVEPVWRAARAGLVTDVDGTISPIVARPEEARVLPDARDGARTACSDRLAAGGGRHRAGRRRRPTAWSASTG